MIVKHLPNHAIWNASSEQIHVLLGAKDLVGKVADLLFFAIH